MWKILLNELGLSELNLNDFIRQFVRFILCFVFLVSFLSKLFVISKFTDKIIKIFSILQIDIIENNEPMILTTLILIFLVEFIIFFGYYNNWQSYYFHFFSVFTIGAFTLITLFMFLEGTFENCGCFGDLIVLNNFETFIKNIMLLGLAIISFLQIKKKRLGN